jgi:hypothetical protein
MPDYGSGPLAVRSTQDLIATASATVSTALSLAITPNTNYLIDTTVDFTNVGVSTFAAQVHALPSGASLVYIGLGNASAVVTSTGTNITGGAGAAPSVRYSGLVTVGNNPGTFTIDAVNTAASGSVTVKAGSWLTLTPVP